MTEWREVHERLKSRFKHVLANGHLLQFLGKATLKKYFIREFKETANVVCKTPALISTYGELMEDREGLGGLEKNQHYAFLKGRWSIMFYFLFIFFFFPEL